MKSNYRRDVLVKFNLKPSTQRLSHDVIDFFFYHGPALEN